MKTVKKGNCYLGVHRILLGSVVLTALALLIAGPCLAAGPDYRADVEAWFISHWGGGTILTALFWLFNDGGQGGPNPPVQAWINVSSNTGSPGNSPSEVCSFSADVAPLAPGGSLLVAALRVIYDDPPGSHMRDYRMQAWNPNHERMYGQFGNGQRVRYSVSGVVAELNNGYPYQDTNLSNNTAEKTGTLPRGGVPHCWDCSGLANRWMCLE